MDDARTQTGRSGEQHFSGADRIGAPLEFGVRSNGDLSGIDLRLQRPQGRIVDDMGRIAPRLMVPNFAAELGGAFVVAVPFDAPAPSQRQVAR